MQEICFDEKFATPRVFEKKAQTTKPLKHILFKFCLRIHFSVIYT